MVNISFDDGGSRDGSKTSFSQPANDVRKKTKMIVSIIFFIVDSQTQNCDFLKAYFIPPNYDYIYYKLVH